MKFLKIIDFLVPLAALMINAGSFGAEAVRGNISGICQLQTSDQDNRYFLTFNAATDRSLFQYDVKAVNSDGMVKMIAQDSNRSSAFTLPQVIILLSGDGETKQLKIASSAGFLSRADKFIVTKRFAIELTQVIHPEDGTRAAGAIFYGVNSLSGQGATFLPMGVSLTGVGNCYHLTGVKELGF